MRKNTPIKLTSLVKEIKRQQNRTLKEFNYQTNKLISFQAIINSNALLENETIALKKFFEFYNNGNIPIVTEGTIRRIDLYLSSSIITEGFAEWMQKVGSKAEEWFSSGWSKIKQVWKNFSDIVSKVTAEIKKFFKTLSSKVYDGIKQLSLKAKQTLLNKVDKIQDAVRANPEGIKKETATFSKSVTALLDFCKPWVDGTAWITKVLSGNVSEITEEISRQKPNLVFDKSLVEALLEAEGVEFADILVNKDKYPKLHTIIEYAFKALAWVASPVTQLIKTGIKLLFGGEEGDTGILYCTNKLANKLTGSPEIITYPILALLVAEVFEIVAVKFHIEEGFGVYDHALELAGIKDVVIEFIKEYVPIFGEALKALEILFAIVAFGIILENIFPGILEKIGSKAAKVLSAGGTQLAGDARR